MTDALGLLAMFILNAPVICWQWQVLGLSGNAENMSWSHLQEVVAPLLNIGE